MKLYAPSYYKNFSCIQGKCRHSCCIGWEIDIDKRAAQKYAALSHSYKDRILKSIKTEETMYFRLLENGKCPHLDSMGLCKIITELGEDYLCDICREHPRFYNLTAHRKEVGLGMACEEACRIILSSDGYADFIEIGEMPDEELANFDTLPIREKIFSILRDSALSYNEALKKIYKEFNVCPDMLSSKESLQLISSLEYLSPESKERFLSYCPTLSEGGDTDILMRRALAYFVYRHVTPIESESELRGSLGLALFLERLLFSVAAYENLCDTGSFISLARTISEEIEYSEENCDLIKTEFIFA